MTEGIRIEVPEAPAAAGFGEEFTLPVSGLKARVRRGKGRDLRMAQMAAGDGNDNGKLDNAVTARLAIIDGKLATFEQVEDLDLADFIALKAMVAAANTVPSAPAGGDNASSG